MYGLAREGINMKREQKINFSLRCLFIFVIILEYVIVIYFRDDYQKKSLINLCNILFNLVACLILSRSFHFWEKYKASFGLKRMVYFIAPFSVFLVLTLFSKLNS